MSEKLPKMPEPAVMCDCGGNYYTASQVLSLQRDTWMQAMEVAAKTVESFRDDFEERRAHMASNMRTGDIAEDLRRLKHNQGVALWQAALRKSAAAIRALPMPEGGSAPSPKAQEAE